MMFWRASGTNYYTLEEFVSIHNLETCFWLGARGLQPTCIGLAHHLFSPTYTSIHTKRGAAHTHIDHNEVPQSGLCTQAVRNDA